MPSFRSLVNGFVGACCLTAAHQAVRLVTEDAPRMDVLGMRSLEKMLGSIGVSAPRGPALVAISVIGDLVCNTLYYSQVGSKSGFLTWSKGLSLGVAYGAAAMAAPPKLGLGSESSQKTMITKCLTVGLFGFGGLCAAAAAQVGSPQKKK